MFKNKTTLKYVLYRREGLLGRFELELCQHDLQGLCVSHISVPIFWGCLNKSLPQMLFVTICYFYRIVKTVDTVSAIQPASGITTVVI